MTLERDRLADSATEDGDPPNAGGWQLGDLRWPPARISGQHRAPRNRLHARLIDIVAGRPRKNGEPRNTRWIVLVWLVALIILLANDSGRIFFDTKLGVDIDPVGFYARLWHLWNPSEWFGTLQDQYIGYAVPMGPFYLIAHLLHLPVWFTERLWLATLITVGFTGIVKLAQALGIGTERSRVVAGVAYALWPTFTILIGSTSAGLLPGLLAPWAVLPLVSAARGSAPARAAARSGVAVLCMGGVNATSTLDALILPALYILITMRGRALIKLGLYWSGAVFLATSWWVVPLLLQGKYSFNFLPYVEQAATTTATMSAATFLRGSGNWTAYLNLGQPWLSSGWVVVTSPMVIIAATVTAATGLLGIARRDLPSGVWLRWCLALSAIVALVGYPGTLGGPFHSTVDQLFNAALSPFRSVYKVEPAAAAVLALGIAHALVLRSKRRLIISDPAPRVIWHVVASAMIGLVLIGLGYPYLSAQVLNPGSFNSVPRYWDQVATYLQRHSPQAPALVAPGSAHGTFLWGTTVDEPLEALANTPWVTQGLVPYGGAGSQLLLSSVESAIASGEEVPGLAETLARSGVRYVVVRNDLNPGAVDYVSPQPVHQALLSSGFRRVAAFGPFVTGAQTNPGATSIQYALPSYPAVEIFEARSAAGTRVPPAAAALPLRRTVLVNGGPDALLQLTGQGVLGTAPAVIAGNKLVAKPELWAVTDSLPRSDHTFGSTNLTGSYTYTRTETNPIDDPLGGAGGPPREMLPVPAAGHQTVAVLSGAVAVTASSTGTWVSESPQIDPVNAFDGDPSTYWVEASPRTPVGQWIQITFDHQIELPSSIGIDLLVNGSLRPVADRLTVTTDSGSVTSSVRRTGKTQPLAVKPGRTKTLRITIAGSRGQVPGGPGAGFSDIAIPGVTVTRYSAPAEDPAGKRAPVVAFSFHRQLPSPGSLADVAAYPPMARMFTIPGTDTFKIAASAIAIPGRKLDALLAGLTPTRPDSLEVTTTSTWGSLPSLAPYHLFKATHQSAWIAGAGKPVLRLQWKGKRTIHRMVIQAVQGFAAAPESIKIDSPDGTRYASLGLDGITAIVPPLKTDQMSISFPVVSYTTSAQPVSGQPVELPVGLARLYIPALNGLVAREPSARTPFTLPCGRGPWLTIDGQRYPTQVSGTVGDLTGFHPVQITLCSDGSMLTLPPGQHQVLAARDGPFSVTDLSLTSGFPSATVSGPAGTAPLKTVAAGPANSGGGRRVSILHWQPEFRQVRIGPGAASYLELHQNANPGWVATLNGKTLAPAELDGWQQAFVVPAGAGGVITLTFAPVKFYHAWIILSAAGAIALLALASVRRRRRRVHDQMARALTRSAPAASVPVVGGWLQRTFFSSGLSGWPVWAFARDSEWRSGSAARSVPGPGSGSVSAETASAEKVSADAASGKRFRPSRPPLPAWVGLGLVCVAIALIGGPVALVVPVLAIAAFMWPDWYAAIAFVALVATGLITAFTGQRTVIGSGPFGGPAQALALIALAAALMPSWPGAHRLTSAQLAAQAQAQAVQPGSEPGSGSRVPAAPGQQPAAGPGFEPSQPTPHLTPGANTPGAPANAGRGPSIPGGPPGVRPGQNAPGGPPGGGPGSPVPGQSWPNQRPGGPGPGQSGPDQSGPGQPYRGPEPGGGRPGGRAPGQHRPGGPGPGHSVPGQRPPGGMPGGPGPARSVPGQHRPGGMPGGPGSARSVPGQSVPGQSVPGQAVPGQERRGPGPGGPVPGQSWPGRPVGGPGADRSMPGQPWHGPRPGGAPSNGPGPGGPGPGGSRPGGPGPGGRGPGGPPWPDWSGPEPGRPAGGPELDQPGQHQPGARQSGPPRAPRPWEPGGDQHWPGQFDVGQGPGGSPPRPRRGSGGGRWSGHGGGTDQP
ncbi:MAG TPA: alpha-(1-_3)-arabinofuranosyltransferase family protein [Streptosporangiaceae bacterium]|nr:alpha-(1->3)-arabinofuranosyltransferase family protein [Streptosporangiaceae bacterium]